MYKKLFSFFIVGAFYSGGIHAEQEWPPLNAAGYIDGESITFDPNTGNYIVKYYGDPGASKGVTNRMITLIYDTPNKIKPDVKVRIRTGRERDVVYNFDVSNGKTAKQDIYAFSFTARTGWFENLSLVSNASASTQIAAGNLAGAAQTMEGKLTYAGSIEDTRMSQPAKWLPEIGFAKSGKAFSVEWQAHPNKKPLDDIKPGQQRKGFGLAMPYLPGIVEFDFSGNGKSFGFPGAAGGDSKIWKDLDKLMFGSTAPAPSVASLGPKILIPEPYNTKALATGISNDLASWVEAGQLSETLAQKLRLSFAAIGDAAESNNPSGVAGNAERVFRDLFSRHDGMNHRHIEEDEDEDHDKAKHHTNHYTDLYSSKANHASSTPQQSQHRFVLFESKSQNDNNKSSNHQHESSCHQHRGHRINDGTRSLSVLRHICGTAFVG